MPTATYALPIIDVAEFEKGDEVLDKKIATALVSAFHTRGFAYVCGHGVSEEARGAVFEQGFRFMHLPPEKKMKMVCGLDGIDTMGYAYPGMAKVAQNEDVVGEELEKLVRGAPGANESFRFTDSENRNQAERLPSEEDMPNFVETLLPYMDQCTELYFKLMRVLTLGLGIQPGFFDKYHPNGANRTLVYQHYLGGPASQSGARLNEHTDYGFMTVLFQDSVGGLEVVDASQGNQFIPAPPVEGAATVNVGDMLSRWTNGILKSTMHRVRAPPGSIHGDMLPERLSVPVFCGPVPNTIVEPIPGTYDENRPKLFEAVNATTHLHARQAKMYILPEKYRAPVTA